MLLNLKDVTANVCSLFDWTGRRMVLWQPLALLRLSMNSINAQLLIFSQLVTWLCLLIDPMTALPLAGTSYTATGLQQCQGHSRIMTSTCHSFPIHSQSPNHLPPAAVFSLSFHTLSPPPPPTLLNPSPKTTMCGYHGNLIHCLTFSSSTEGLEQLSVQCWARACSFRFGPLSVVSLMQKQLY